MTMIQAHGYFVAAGGKEMGGGGGGVINWKRLRKTPKIFFFGGCGEGEKKTG